MIVISSWFWQSSDGLRSVRRAHFPGTDDAAAAGVDLWNLESWRWFEMWAAGCENVALKVEVVHFVRQAVVAESANVVFPKGGWLCACLRGCGDGFGHDWHGRRGERFVSLQFEQAIEAEEFRRAVDVAAVRILDHRTESGAVIAVMLVCLSEDFVIPA